MILFKNYTYSDLADNASNLMQQYPELANDFYLILKRLKSKLTNLEPYEETIVLKLEEM